MVWITTTIKSQHFTNYTVCLQKMYYFRIQGLFLKAVNGAGLFLDTDGVDAASTVPVA